MNSLLALSQNPISIVDLLISLSLALVLGLGMGAVYRLTHRGLNYDRSFLTTVLMIAPIVALVMVFIRSNVALSLGLVGALSIIRFRSVIKDTRDMVFLFWAIAVGLGCGTYSWVPTIVAALFLAAAILTLYFFEYGKAVHADYVLVITGDSEDALAELRGWIKKRVGAAEIRSLESEQGTWELVLELRLLKKRDSLEHSLVMDLKKRPGITKVSLLAPQLALPL